jgi:hypothetical protein
MSGVCVAGEDEVQELTTRTASARLTFRILQPQIIKRSEIITGASAESAERNVAEGLIAVSPRGNECVAGEEECSLLED